MIDSHHIPDSRENSIPPRLVSLLRSPKSGRPLFECAGRLLTADGESYAVSPSGIPLFAREILSEAGRAQQVQYDGMAVKYVENLAYPHTQEYMAYLDEKLFDVLPEGTLGVVAELCCGRGEAARLLAGRIEYCVGVDVASSLLEIARRELPFGQFDFVQGDATMLPLRDACFDTVVMLGGIHHVPDRARLFSEVFRILRPGGRFYYREPSDDFVLWRGIRKIVYRASPMLDHNAERPLRYEDTVPVLAAVGLETTSWRTYGFLGFCLFMNSDVLVFNRMFRYLPGIRMLTRIACLIDDLTTRLPGLRGAGLQVVGTARRPV